MNLLQETIEILENHDKSKYDVKWVGNDKFYTDWENFELISDVEYDDGYGCQEVAADLIIVGETWWIERHEYDGSEWWEFKQFPKMPEIKRTINKVVGGCWSSIEEIENR